MYSEFALDVAHKLWLLRRRKNAGLVQKTSVEVVLGDVVEEIKSLSEEINVLKQSKNNDDELNALREEVVKLNKQ